MVILPGQNGITAHICLGDGEALPLQFNSEKIVVYRRGASTDNALKIEKPLGIILESGHPLLKDPTKYVCAYEGGDPIHEHENGDWYFYEESRSYENGPFETWEECYQALAEYCLGLEKAKQIYVEMMNERMNGNEPLAEVEGDVSDGTGVVADSDGSLGEVDRGVED